MNTDYKNTNPMDFIWINAEAKAFRCRVLNDAHNLFEFRHDTKSWAWVRELQGEELLEMAKCAVPHPLCLNFEYGMPFLPMSQHDLFQQLAPYHKDCLITPANGQFAVLLLFKPGRIGKPVRVLSYSWGNRKTSAFHYACTFFLN